MKTRSILLGIASLAAGLTSALAQTAVTDPVGYITVELEGSTNGYSAISPSLVNKVEFAGAVATAAGTTLNFTGTPLSTLTLNSGYWIEITNGAGEGTWTNIVSNTASSVVTSADISAQITAGVTTVKIRKHVTVSQFFGATNSAGLQPGGDAGLADEVFFIAPGDAPGSTTEVFYDGAGWSDLDFNPAADKIIPPNQGLLVAQKTATPKSFVFVGHVKTGKTKINIAAGNNVVAIPSAVGYTLATSGLSSILTAGGDAGLADEVFLFDTNTLGISHFFDGAAWNDQDFNAQNTKVLKEGSAAYVIRKSAGVDWTAPAVTIAP